MQFHASLLFHHFCLREVIAGGFTSHLTSHKSVFHKKYSIKGQHFVNSFSYTSSTVLRLAHWLWRRCHLFGFTKAIVYLCRVRLLLRHRCCLYDFTRALFCNPGSNAVDGFLLSLSFCVLFSISAFLHVFVTKLTFNQLGGFDHSVFDTSVQLTEGRSARDQPKQPPAKKAWEWIERQEDAWVQVWHAKQGVFRKKLPPDEMTQ